MIVAGARLDAAEEPSCAAAPARWIPWAVALVLAGCAGLYARGLGGAFVIDDRTFFVENDDLPRLRLADAWVVFVRPTNAWGDFQPVRDLAFLLEHSAFGRSTAGYHVVSLVLYGITCLLAFALARSLLAGSRRAPGADVSALLVMALFAAHPAHVEAVAYICGQKELLSAAFSLGALLAFRRAFASPGGRAGWTAAGIALYALALLSKQTAIMLAVLVPLLYALAPAAGRPRASRSAATWILVHVPALLWMAWSRAEFQEMWANTSAVNAVPPLERLPLALRVLGAHARLAVWPHPLSFGYPFDASAAPDGHLLAGATALAVLAAAARRFREDAAVLFGAAAFVGFLVPVLQLHGSLNNASIYDRYLFLPVLGLALVAERAARAVLVGRCGSTRAHVAVLTAIAVCGAGLTAAYVPAFADDVAVSRNAYERHPGWSRPPFELAYALLEAGRTAEAKELIASEPSLGSPPWVRPYLAGWTALAEGRPDDALPSLRRASTLALEGGYYPFASVPLGRALRETGRLDEAERALRRALAFPLYQPLEAYHARKLLEDVVRRRAGAAPPGR